MPPEPRCQVGEGGYSARAVGARLQARGHPNAVVFRARQQAGEGSWLSILATLCRYAAYVDANLSVANGAKTPCRRGGPLRFKIGNVPELLTMMARPGSQLAIAHRPKLPAEREAGYRHAELVPYPLREIGKTPTHQAMRAGLGPASTIAASRARCPRSGSRLAPAPCASPTRQDLPR